VLERVSTDLHLPPGARILTPMRRGRKHGRVRTPRRRDGIELSATSVCVARERHVAR